MIFERCAKRGLPSSLPTSCLRSVPALGQIRGPGGLISQLITNKFDLGLPLLRVCFGVQL
jgi:hypothetical protein